MLRDPRQVRAGHSPWPHRICTGQIRAPTKRWARLDRGTPWRKLPAMQMSRDKLTAEAGENGAALREAAPEYRAGTEGEIDVSLLEDSLAKTPWERMQANELIRCVSPIRSATQWRDDSGRGEKRRSVRHPCLT
jgi:hypothetical protein